MGSDVLLWLAHVTALESRAKGRVWHSDIINQHVRGIHVSIALTDMNAKSGCLRLVPSSHLYRASLSSIEDIPGDDDPTALALADQIAPWNAPHRVVEMEIKSGQFFFTWGGLWHSVGTNHTEIPRCSVVARYARTDVTCTDYGIDDSKINDIKKLPCLLVSGRDDFGLNLILDQPINDIFVNEKFMRSSPWRLMLRKLKPRI